MVQQLQLELTGERLAAVSSPETQIDIARNVLDSLPPQITDIVEHYDEICQTSATSSAELGALLAGQPDPAHYMGELLANYLDKTKGAGFDADKADKFVLVEKLKNEAALKSDADSVLQRAQARVITSVAGGFKTGHFTIGENSYFLDIDPFDDGKKRLFRLRTDGNPILYDLNVKPKDIKARFDKASLADTIILINDLKSAAQLHAETPSL